ncbi:hypothetical protein NL676_017024 [Syzygium grande]|nr:hypothetical protein NL676_017024 [Syzygium grande]
MASKLGAVAIVLAVMAVVPGSERIDPSPPPASHPRSSAAATLPSLELEPLSLANSAVSIAGAKEAMASKLGAVAIVLAVMAVVLALNASTHLLRPPPIPGAHVCRHASKVVPVGGAHGPESLAFDPSGPYAGIADGQILKWEGDRRGWVNFAFTSSERYDVKSMLCSCST